MKTVLFICAENSFRSQIAEAYFNKYAPKGWRAMSAGVTPAERVHPNAVKLMLEEDADIREKKPQPLTPELQEQAELVVIVCGGGLCPVVSAKYVERWEVPDPAPMTIEEAREVREGIKRRVFGLIERLRVFGSGKLEA